MYLYYHQGKEQYAYSLFDHYISQHLEAPSHSISEEAKNPALPNSLPKKTEVAKNPVLPKNPASQHIGSTTVVDCNDDNRAL